MMTQSHSDSDKPTSETRLAHLGVDVGGTFTDLIMVDSEGNVQYTKVANTPGDWAASTLEGITRLSHDRIDLSSIRHTHGNTIGVNTLIERRGAKLGMLVTSGFRDLLALARLSAPDPMRYDSRRAKALIDRESIREIPGRLDVNGNEIIPINTDAVRNAARELTAAGVDAIIVCLLHSYLDSRHEREVQRIVTGEHPQTPVELSSELWPQAREYERALMATINAYVRPNLSTYLDSLAASLDSIGVEAEPMITRSNGGMQRSSSIYSSPITTLLSGPAAGVAAAGAIAQRSEAYLSSVTLDMGGTSADVGIVQDGKPMLSPDEHIANFPLLLPVTAVSSVGAGGGSIVWLDDVGSLKIGPRSAGAMPGPACYGLGGAEPTLTDAFVLAGWIPNGRKLGETISINGSLAEDSFRDIAHRIGCTVQEAADGAIEIASAMLAAEVGAVASRRGIDLLQSNLIAFGGAGPLIASSFAAEAFIEEIIIPSRPGILSAEGAAHAHIEGDFIRPVYQTTDLVSSDEIHVKYEDLKRQATEWLEQEQRARHISNRTMTFSADMRYLGQGYDITIDLDPVWLSEGNTDSIVTRFHEVHESLFGYLDTSSRISIRELRIHVVGETVGPKIAKYEGGSPTSTPGLRSIRLGGQTLTAEVFDRSELTANVELEGPALIEQSDSTTIVPPMWTATVHPLGDIYVARSEPTDQTFPHFRNTFNRSTS